MKFSLIAVLSVLSFLSVEVLAGCCSWGAPQCHGCGPDLWCNSAKGNCEGACSGTWCEELNPSGPTQPTPQPRPAGCTLPAGLTDSPDVDATGFARAHGKLRLSGVQLVDSAGQPVQLTGMSSHGLHWFPDCYNKDSLSFLVKHWGITVFRAAMYIDEGGYRVNPSLAAMVDNIVDWCEELGIYVIIDWHVLNPGDPNAYLSSRGARTGFAVDYWTSTAAKYRSKSHVLYELANEPNNVDWPSVKAYHDAMISVIRAVDPNTVIICGTTNWSQDIHLAAANPVAQPFNVMYTFHFYVGSHMGLMPRVREFARVIPLFVTEWGTSNADGAGGPYLDDALQWLNMLGDNSLGVKISWAQWSYASKNEASAALVETACGQRAWDATSCSGSFVRSFLKSHSEAKPFTSNAMFNPEGSQNDTNVTLIVMVAVAGVVGVAAVVGLVVLRQKRQRNVGPAYDSRTLKGQDLTAVLLEGQETSNSLA